MFYLFLNSLLWFFFIFRYSSQILLDLHLKQSHLKEKSEICEYCAKRFACKYQLQAHVKKVHLKDPSKLKEKVQCTVCDRWYTGKHNLERHMLTHGTDTVKCDKCHKILANQVSLYRHNRTFHENGGLMFECHLCPKTFRNQYDLQVNCKEY